MYLRHNAKLRRSRANSRLYKWAEHGDLFKPATGRTLRRAVANGPVGPAMAGPIIKPAIKKTLFFLFFNIYFWLGLVGIINEKVFF